MLRSGTMDMNSSACERLEVIIYVLITNSVLWNLDKYKHVNNESSQHSQTQDVAGYRGKQQSILNEIVKRITED